jgi:hypothetical protein
MTTHVYNDTTYSVPFMMLQPSSTYIFIYEWNRHCFEKKTPGIQKKLVETHKHNASP